MVARLLPGQERSYNSSGGRGGQRLRHVGQVRGVREGALVTVGEGDRDSSLEIVDTGREASTGNGKDVVRGLRPSVGRGGVRGERAVGGQISVLVRERCLGHGRHERASGGARGRGHKGLDRRVGAEIA